MKELTIEEKAKAYDEALKRAREWHNDSHITIGLKGNLEDIFPELKESEDERIRKELIEYIKDQQSSFISAPDCRDKYEEEENNKYNSWIAWLEKQKDCEYIKKDWLEHIKQSWYKEGFIDGKYSGGTSKEWTINDAATLKELIDFLENGTAKLQHDLTKYANWLKIQFTPIEKRGEQKSADKIEPKFHEGDWVVYCNDDVYLITGIEENGYRINNGGYIPFICENKMRLWDITDAKVGDVLVSESTCGLGTWYCIFKSLDGDESMTVYCYLTRDGRFETKKELCFDKDPYNTKPATKEQRNTLLKAMSDAGYTFDFEKKELKKISQRMVSAEAKEALYDKPAWSEEDEEILRTIISDGLRGAEFDMLQINWLKSLKQRIGWKPSEEQIECLYDAINHYQTNGYPASKLNELYEQMSKIYKL